MFLTLNISPYLHNYLPCYCCNSVPISTGENPHHPLQFSLNATMSINHLISSTKYFFLSFYVTIHDTTFLHDTNPIAFLLQLIISQQGKEASLVKLCIIQQLSGLSNCSRIRLSNLEGHYNLKRTKRKTK